MSETTISMTGVSLPQQTASLSLFNFGGVRCQILPLLLPYRYACTKRSSSSSLHTSNSWSSLHLSSGSHNVNVRWVSLPNVALNTLLQRSSPCCAGQVLVSFFKLFKGFKRFENCLMLSNIIPAMLISTRLTAFAMFRNISSGAAQ